MEVFVCQANSLVVLMCIPISILISLVFHLGTESLEITMFNEVASTANFAQKPHCKIKNRLNLRIIATI